MDFISSPCCVIEFSITQLWEALKYILKYTPPVSRNDVGKHNVINNKEKDHLNNDNNVPATEV